MGGCYRQESLVSDRLVVGGLEGGIGYWCDTMYLFQLSCCKQCPFHSLFNNTVLTFLLILLFKIARRHRAAYLVS